MHAETCIHFLIHDEKDTLREAVIRGLKNAGVCLQRRDRIPFAGHGICVIDRYSDRIVDLLRTYGAARPSRALVITCPGVRLQACEMWNLLSAGASDVVAWNDDSTASQSVAARLHRWKIVDELVQSPLVTRSLVGSSPRWIHVLREIVEAAYFTDIPMLITGESGTGKELAARLIHTLDQRPNKKDLVLVDCTTIKPELSGSEFFGHERGSFTGAVAVREGAFALADCGTLFLDEVGELPLRLQTELLRVIQEKTYKRLGSNTWNETSFRLVCATNKDLVAEEAKGTFRRDLYYRIAGWTCALPPLRERTEDIPALAAHFVKSLIDGDEEPVFDEAVHSRLMQRSYPGNVRDLKQLMTRIVQRHVGKGPITVGDVPEEERPPAEGQRNKWHDSDFENAIRRAVLSGISLKEIGRVSEDTAVRIAFDEEDGKLHRVATRLGVTERALQMRRAAQRQRLDELMSEVPSPDHAAA